MQRHIRSAEEKQAIITEVQDRVSKGEIVKNILKEKKVTPGSYYSWERRVRGKTRVKAIQHLTIPLQDAAKPMLFFYGDSQDFLVALDKLVQLKGR